MSEAADPGSDTIATGTAVADSPNADASTGGTSADQGSANAATPAENGKPSLADGNEVNQQQATPPVAQATSGSQVQPNVVTEDWKKRYDGQFQSFQRISREKKELESQLEQHRQQLAQVQQQFQGITPDLLQKVRLQQETASLPVWNPKHPEHDGFRSTLAKYQFFNELYSAEADPELKKALASRFQAMVPASERAKIAQFEEYQNQERLRMSMDPQGYIQRQVQDQIRQEIEQFRTNTVRSYQETVNAQSELANLQRQYPQVATAENLPKVHALVQQGYPLAAAFHAVRADLLEQQISGAKNAKASADEKERLLTQQATISRDAAVTPKVDLYAEATKVAKAKNIPPGDKRFLGILDDLRRKHNIKE